MRETEIIPIEHPNINQPKLIDSGALWDSIQNEKEMGISDIQEAFNNALDNTPLVDAVLVVHSFWEWNVEYHASRCHNCGACFNGLMKHRFCPDCGARMDSARKIEE